MPPHDFQTDLDDISAIPAVANILEVVARSTGMGFVAVARVTEGRWICCASRDNLAFGVGPGDELVIETTICNEIRSSGQAVVIDHVAENRDYRGHPTPARYGFQSYISFPILLPDRTFFGTLCAIDPRPNKLDNPGVRGMFQLFAALIAFQLDSLRKLNAMQQEILDMNHRFRDGLGHDMKNTLMTMEAGARLLERTPLNDRAMLIVQQMQQSAKLLADQITSAMDSQRRPD